MSQTLCQPRCAQLGNRRVDESLSKSVRSSLLKKRVDRETPNLLSRQITIQQGGGHRKFESSRGRRRRRIKGKKGRESETAAAEWKSHTKLRVTYHFPLIRISGTTEPGDVQACTVKYSEEVWPGVNQRGKPTLSCQPLLRCIAPTWMFRHSIYIRTCILRSSSATLLFSTRRPMRFNYRSLLFTPCRGNEGRNTARFRVNARSFNASDCLTPSGERDWQRDI